MGLFMSKQGKAFQPKWDELVQILFEKVCEDVGDNYDIFLELLLETAKEGGLTERDFYIYREYTIQHFSNPKSNFWKAFFRVFGKYVKQQQYIPK